MPGSLSLDGKIAVVTGGSRGLGRAMSLGFADAGATVVVASRKVEACREVADEIVAAGGSALPVACHVADWGQCDALVAAAVEEYGRIDVLVNNAGIGPTAPSLAEVSEELFDKTMGVNLRGPLRLSTQAAAHMPDGGTIINISSAASVRPMPLTAVYAMAKAGLNVLTSVLAQEYAPQGIRANGIICGTFRTDSLAHLVVDEETESYIAGTCVLNRIAAPEEIIGTALYLASDASSYTTGQMIQVDGGVLP